MRKIGLKGKTLLAAFCVSLCGRAWAAGRTVIEFDPSLDAAGRAAIAAKAGYRVVEDLDPLPACAVEPAPGVLTPQDFSLRADPKVVNVEPDFYANWLVSQQADSMQSLPLPSLESFLAEAPPPKLPEERIPWGVARVNAPKAWPVTKGEGVRVAVIDTGVGPHPDLQVSGGFNASLFGSGYDDDNGHGTHVAGIISARMNGIGVIGVAPAVDIYAVKVLNKQGSGWATSIARGIAWCGKNRIQVANLSLGSPKGMFLMHWAVDIARSQGVTIVAAAGNSGGPVEYPGAYDGVIAVGASDSSDNLASFSSRGRQVAFIAPGVKILSSVPGGYEEWDGTSMATPHVAGLAALAVSVGITGPDAVAAAMRAAATPLPNVPAEAQGAGMIDALKLVESGREALRASLH